MNKCKIPPYSRTNLTVARARAWKKRSVPYRLVAITRMSWMKPAKVISRAMLPVS